MRIRPYAEVDSNQNNPILPELYNYNIENTLYLTTLLQKNLCEAFFASFVVLFEFNFRRSICIGFQLETCLSWVLLMLLLILFSSFLSLPPGLGEIIIDFFLRLGTGVCRILIWFLSRNERWTDRKHYCFYLPTNLYFRSSKGRASSAWRRFITWFWVPWILPRPLICFATTRVIRQVMAVFLWK